MLNKVKSFIKEDRGQGMAEYGLIVVIIAIGVFVTVGLFRDELKATFDNIKAKFEGARAAG